MKIDKRIKPAITELDTIAKRLRAARLLRQLTQEKLAEKVGTSQSVVQKIENGHSKRPRCAERLAESLECRPGWLVFGDQPPPEWLASNWTRITPAQRRGLVS